MVREWVECHNVSIQVGDVFKHMRLPENDEADVQHVALAVLVEKAHGEHKATKRAAMVSKIEVDGETILKAWMLRRKS